MDVRLDNVPKDNLLIVEAGGWCYVTLYKNVKEETNESGEKVYKADAVSFQVKEITRKSVIEHFDYYWNKYYTPILNKAKGAKIVELQELLAKTDYRNDKRSEGALSNEDFEKHKAMRAAWRAAINALEAAKTMEEINSVRYNTSTAL